MLAGIVYIQPANQLRRYPLFRLTQTKAGITGKKAGTDISLVQPPVIFVVTPCNLRVERLRRLENRLALRIFQKRIGECLFMAVLDKTAAVIGTKTMTVKRYYELLSLQINAMQLSDIPRTIDLSLIHI